MKPTTPTPWPYCLAVASVIAVTGTVAVTGAVGSAGAAVARGPWPAGRVTRPWRIWSPHGQRS